MATGLGFLGAFAVLAILLYVAGIEEFLAELAKADRLTVALVVPVTLGWLFAWGVSLHVVLTVLGVDISVTKSFFVMNGAMFSNNITPFGQAGGEPVTALLISNVAETEFERGLAAIASVDSLNFVPSILLALLGAGYYAAQTSFGRRLQVAAGGLVVLAVTIPGLGYLGWRKRDAIGNRVARVLAVVVARVVKIVPGHTAPTPASIRARVGRFVHSIERIGTDRRGIALALGASTAGWVCQMIALWVAFVAIGSPIPFSVLLFVVPVGALAGVTPFPGGAGGIEGVLVFVLQSLPTIGIGLETALAAVIIYRGAVYWIPVIIGGTVMSVVGIDSV